VIADRVAHVHLQEFCSSVENAPRLQLHQMERNLKHLQADYPVREYKDFNRRGQRIFTYNGPSVRNSMPSHPITEHVQVWRLESTFFRTVTNVIAALLWRYCDSGPHEHLHLLIK